MSKRLKRAKKIKWALKENSTPVNSFGDIEALRIVSNKGRLLILWLLYERERSVSEIATKLQMSQPRVSQHLAALRTKGLVETKREGRKIFYSLKRGETTKLLDPLVMFLPSRTLTGESR